MSVFDSALELRLSGRISPRAKDLSQPRRGRRPDVWQSCVNRNLTTVIHLSHVAAGRVGQ